MTRSILAAAALAACAPKAPLEAAAPVEAAPAFAGRTFDFTYAVTVPPPDDGGAYDLYLPLPTNDEHQRVADLVVTSPVEGERGVGDGGNAFWHARVEGQSEPLTVELRLRVTRARVENEPPATGRALTDEERATYAAWLAPSALVPVGDDVPALQPLLADVRAAAADDSPAAQARAIYDLVVDTMEYKKTGEGWGNGDTIWACSEKYGNCTDFHSVFLSLARTLGIPARFEMGFPVPAGRTDGELGGYHCWVAFWLPDVGWVPIDASEASKHPEDKELFYGAWPADRVRFTVGRDLRLGAGQQGPPLNYFIYPYLEKDGVAYKPELERRFAFQEVGAAG